MPSWKKVAVSGSSPTFNHITASGNISSSGTIEATGNISTDAIINAPEGVFTDNIEINKTALPKLQLKDGTNDRKLIIQVANSMTEFINNDNAAHDLRFKLNGEDNHLYLEAQNNRVGIGDNAPNQKLGIKGTNAQISIEEDDTEFLRLGVGETENDAIIGYHDDNFLRFGVYSSPTDTSIDTHMSIGPTGHITASGNISASGDLIIDDITADDVTADKVLTDEIDNNTGNISLNVAEGGNINFLMESAQRLGFTLAESSTTITSPVHFTLMTQNSKDIIFDSEGKIELNSDTGDIQFKDASTTLGGVNNSGIFSSNHITASGNISASGIIRTSRLRVDNHIAVDSSGDIGLLFDDSGINNIKIGRSGAHITASGNISASGYGDGGIVEISRFQEVGIISVDSAAAVGNSGLHLNVDGTAKIQIGKGNLPTIFQSDVQTFGGEIFFASASGHITASGNISSSEYVYADRFIASGQVRVGGVTTLTYSDPELRLGYHTDLPIQIGKTITSRTNFAGNITASGNISSSGTMTMLTASIGGGIFTSASLAAGGGGGAVSAVANGSDNRLATFSSANALNGEANLTFDGSILEVVGNISASGNTQVNQITASAFQFVGSGNAELEVQGHITASGNISASGTDGHSFGGNTTFDNQIVVGGHLTANGNIFGDGATNISSINTITASAISSSGTMTMLTASIGGGIFTSASLAAGGGGSSFSFTGDQFATDLKVGRDSHNHIDFTTDNQIDFLVDNESTFTLINTSDSGSIAVSGSIKIQPQTTVPAVSESRLYNKTTTNGNVVDDLQFGTAGLTPDYAWVSLNDDGTLGTSELIFGKDSAVTSTAYNMTVVHDTSTNGTRIYAQLDGVYKVQQLATIQGGSGTTTFKLKVDGSDVHTKNFFVHGAVDPVDRSHIYVGSISSGSYVSATLTGDGTDNTSYEDGSILMVERLS